MRMMMNTCADVPHALRKLGMHLSMSAENFSRSERVRIIWPRRVTLGLVAARDGLLFLWLPLFKTVRPSTAFDRSVWPKFTTSAWNLRHFSQAQVKQEETLIFKVLTRPTSRRQLVRLLLAISYGFLCKQYCLVGPSCGIVCAGSIDPSWRYLDKAHGLISNWALRRPIPSYSELAHLYDVLYCAGILFSDDGTRIGAADKAEGDGDHPHEDKDDDRSKAPAAAPKANTNNDSSGSDDDA